MRMFLAAPQPPGLFVFYGQGLGLPPALIATWWYALDRSREAGMVKLCQAFRMHSGALAWNHETLFAQVEPGPVVAIVERLMQTSLLPHATGNVLIEAILAQTTGQDWRGVQMQPRWLRDDERTHHTKE
jgi:hypothetical protein